MERSKYGCLDAVLITLLIFGISLIAITLIWFGIAAVTRTPIEW